MYSVMVLTDPILPIEPRVGEYVHCQNLCNIVSIYSIETWNCY